MLVIQDVAMKEQLKQKTSFNFEWKKKGDNGWLSDEASN